MDNRNELIADFQQFYGLDLETLLLNGEFKRIKALTLALPIKARVISKISPELAWDEDAYLLALIADNIAFLRYEQSGGKGKKPKQLERPKAKKKPKEKKTLDVSDKRIQSLLFAKRK